MATKKPPIQGYTPTVKCKFLINSDKQNALEHKEIIKSLNEFHDKFENTFNKIPLNGSGKTIDFQTFAHVIMETTKSKRTLRKLITDLVEWRKSTTTGKWALYAIIALTIISYLHTFGIIHNPIQAIATLIEAWIKNKIGG